MSRQHSSRGLSPAEPGTWYVLALSGVFVLLGLLFILAPRMGAALFGLPAPEGASLGYLPVIGLRDLAFGLYLFALARLAGRRAVGTVLAITVLIPAGDVAIVALERGWSSPGHLLLHAASGGAMLAGAVWMLSGTQAHGEAGHP
jgi:hypothetical protein